MTEISYEAGNNVGDDLAPALYQAKHLDLTCGTTTASSLAMAPEIALVNLDLAEQRGRIRTLLSVMGPTLKAIIDVKVVPDSIVNRNDTA